MSRVGYLLGALAGVTLFCHGMNNWVDSKPENIARYETERYIRELKEIQEQRDPTNKTLDKLIKQSEASLKEIPYDKENAAEFGGNMKYTATGTIIAGVALTLMGMRNRRD